MQRLRSLPWSTWWARALIGWLVGAALGVAAWGEGRVPALALALPVLIVASRTRLQAFFVAAGYAMAVLRYTASFIASWFDNNLLIGASALAAYALVSGAAWCIGWSRSERVEWRMGAITLAWLLSVLPPATVAVPGHPVIAAGYLFPGTGWIGATATWMLPLLVVWGGSRRWVSPAWAKAVVFAGMLGSLGLAGVLLNGLPGNSPASASRGVVAQHTAWGYLGGQDEALDRLQRMGSVPVPDTTLTVIWPESIIGRYEPAMFRVLDLELLGPARRAGRTHVVGMDVPMNGNLLLNAAVAFYPDRTTATAVARQPAPLSLWRPWRSTDTFVADWRANNMLNLGQGDRAAVIFCYEEYLPALYLLNEALDSPTVYVALTNTWAAREPGAAAIQTLHSLGMARLFGRPYIKAENRPNALPAPPSTDPASGLPARRP